MDEMQTTPGTRRRAAKTQRIVDAATAIVIEEGFDALSVQRLAEALDYTPGALYRYFSSKDAVLAEVIVGVIEAIGRELEEEAARHASAGPIVVLVAVARRWERFAVESPNRFHLVAALMASPKLLLPDPGLSGPAIAAMLKATAPVHAALARAAAEGALTRGDPSERGLVLFAALQGALLLRKQSLHAPELIDARRIYAATLGTLLRGWGASPFTLDGLLSATTPRSSLP
jgi:AcrR family transcriptional regulator